MNVPSDTGSGSYVVEVDEDGNYTCECPAYRFSTEPRRCKHVRRAVNAGLRAPVKAAPTPVHKVTGTGTNEEILSELKHLNKQVGTLLTVTMFANGYITQEKFQSTIEELASR